MYIKFNNLKAAQAIAKSLFLKKLSLGIFLTELLFVNYINNITAAINAVIIGIFMGKLMDRKLIKVY